MHGTPNDNASILSWEETSYDTRGRAYESRTRWGKKGPTIPTDCTGGEFCEVLTSRVGYDVRDRAVVTAAPGLTDTTWRITKTVFDGLGRKLQVTDPLLNVTTLTRNAAGLVTAKTEQEMWDPGTRGKRTWVTGFGYDALGRAVEVKLKGKFEADERIVKRKLDARGLTTAQWTPLGYAAEGDAYGTKWIYDGLGRKKEEWRHLGAKRAWSEDWQKVLYAYDDAGRMTTLTVPNTTSGTLQNQITEFAYDAQGRRTMRCLPDFQQVDGQTQSGFRQEESAYYSSGQLKTLTIRSAGTSCTSAGPKAIVQTSTWDGAGRRTTLDLTTPTTDATHYGGTKKQAWSWDALDRLEKSTDENAAGSGNADDDAIVRYKYDSLGRVLNEGFGESAGNVRWSVVSTYDRRGARESLTHPTAAGGSGTVLTLTADGLGRLTQIHDGATVVATLTHVGAGRLARIVSQDGSVWQGLDWDAAGRRTRGKVTQGEGVNAPLHFEEEIAFDDDDRVLSVKWPHLVSSGRPQVQQFGYDEQARLLKVEQGYGTWSGTEAKWTFTEYSSFHDFHLDEQGNWAEHQDGAGAGASFVSPTIAPNNAYTAWPVSGGSTLDFVLDETGRFLYERPVAGGGKYLYQHDGLGRLVSAEKQNAQGQIVSTSSYGYTADGRLAWRKEGAAAREWLIYDGSRSVVQTTETQLTWTHVWAGSRLVRSSKRGAPDTVYHPHQDRLGSIVVVTRQGQAAEKKLYDAYGRLVAVPNDHDTTPLSIPFGYAGARWEATAGLYQMGARWYDPELGRFIEQDPIGEAGGLNLYAYVGSSPTLWVDPTGLARESSFKGPSSAGGSRSGMRWEMNGTECSSEQAASYMRMAGRRDEGREHGALREREAIGQEALMAKARASVSGRQGDRFPIFHYIGQVSETGATDSAPPPVRSELLQCSELLMNSDTYLDVAVEFSKIKPAIPIYTPDQGARGETRFVPDAESAAAGGPVGSIMLSGEFREQCFQLGEEMKHANDTAKNGIISPEGLSQSEFIKRMKNFEAAAGIVMSKVQTELIQAGVDGAAELYNPLLETYQRATAAGRSESQLLQVIGDRKAQLQADRAVDGSPITYMDQWQYQWHAKNGGP